MAHAGDDPSLDDPAPALFLVRAALLVAAAGSLGGRQAIALATP
jgi:hypothetical protein